MRIIPKKQAFAEACRARKLSVTRQRLAVYEAVLESRAHPGAEEIYQTVSARCRGISRGTVYRTLDTLCDMGFVIDIHRSADTSRFEAVREEDGPHHHLICLACRRIVDLVDRTLQRVPPGARRSAGAAGFEVTGYQVQLTGYCARCRGGRFPKRTQHARHAEEEAFHGQGAQGNKDARQPQRSLRRRVSS